MPTFGSLFTGFGGLDLGLTAAGWECRWMAESNPYARAVLSRSSPGVPVFEDVRRINGEEVEHVQLVCGGDPCQGNSNAGSVHKREREDLAVHFLRIVAEVRPRFVLRENPSVTRPGAAWPWQRFREGLESLGYAVVPFRLRACCLGLHHERERLFLLAELPDAGGLGPQGLDGQGVTAWDACREAGRRVQGSVRRDDVLPAPRVCRGTDGVPGRAQRLVGIGNAVPPVMGEYIGRLLIHAIGA